MGGLIYASVLSKRELATAQDVPIKTAVIAMSQMRREEKRWVSFKSAATFQRHSADLKRALIAGNGYSFFIGFPAISSTACGEARRPLTLPTKGKVAWWTRTPHISRGLTHELMRFLCL
jgi:hypothetical protein